MGPLLSRGLSPPSPVPSVTAFSPPHWPQSCTSVGPFSLLLSLNPTSPSLEAGSPSLEVGSPSLEVGSPSLDAGSPLVLPQGSEAGLTTANPSLGLSPKPFLDARPPRLHISAPVLLPFTFPCGAAVVSTGTPRVCQFTLLKRTQSNTQASPMPNKTPIMTHPETQGSGHMCKFGRYGEVCNRCGCHAVEAAKHHHRLCGECILRNRGIAKVQPCTSPAGGGGCGASVTTAKHMAEPEPADWVPAWLVHNRPENTFIHTTPLTKFESTMVCGYRGIQIGQNSVPRVPTTPNEEPVVIAERELYAGVFPPMAVIRYSPDGSMARKSVADVFRPVRI